MSDPANAPMPDDRLNFAFLSVGFKYMIVRVYPDHCWTQVSAILKLTEELKTRIPFKYTIYWEPQIRVLRKSGSDMATVSVQMVISFEIGDDEAIRQLQAAGFTDNMRPNLIF